MPKVMIHQGFWRECLEINASKAIFHQWGQLQASGCIENFRIAAGLSQGLRQGWFFADWMPINGWMQPCAFGLSALTRAWRR